MQIRWTNKAFDNLDAAVEYITADNPAATTKVAQKIWDSIQLLKDQPGIGRPVRVIGTRELVVCVSTLHLDSCHSVQYPLEGCKEQKI